MKPVPLLFARVPKGAAMSDPLGTLRATPLVTDSTVSHPVVRGQQFHNASEPKGLELNVKRLYQLDLDGQPAQVQPGLLPGRAACL